MKLRSTLRDLGGRIRYTLKAGFTIFSIIYESLVAPAGHRFFYVVILNFLCRVMHLAAFVGSIKALQVAFQYVSSDGQKFTARSVVVQLGIPIEWVPVLLSLVVVGIFALPAFLKRWETNFMAVIARESHQRLGDHMMPLGADLFATSRVPVFLNYVAQLMSGVLFLVIALIIIALIRFDLFALILFCSIAIAIGVVLTTSRHVNALYELRPLRSGYVREAQIAYQEEHNEPNRRPVEEIPLLKGDSRRAFFDLSITNWMTAHRRIFNNGIFTGFAIGSVVWFVFGLENVDGSQLFMLLYLIIAIRYAINTARETGSMVTKLLEARTEMANFRLLVEAARAANVGDAAPTLR